MWLEKKGIIYKIWKPNIYIHTYNIIYADIEIYYISKVYTNLEFNVSHLFKFISMDRDII